jgi:hypothetical protein
MASRGKLQNVSARVTSCTRLAWPGGGLHHILQRQVGQRCERTGHIKQAWVGVDVDAAVQPQALRPLAPAGAMPVPLLYAAKIAAQVGPVSDPAGICRSNWFRVLLRSGAGLIMWATSRQGDDNGPRKCPAIHAPNSVALQTERT